MPYGMVSVTTHSVILVRYTLCSSIHPISLASLKAMADSDIPLHEGMHEMVAGLRDVASRQGSHRFETPLKSFKFQSALKFEKAEFDNHG